MTTDPPPVHPEVRPRAARPEEAAISQTFDTLARERIQVTTALLGAWSSGDPDAPRAYLSADAVLVDSVGGSFHGWPEIRAYFLNGLARYPDLTLTPTGDWWQRPDGLALRWTMTATQQDDSLGADLRGRRWSVDGLSFLVFDGLTVVHEADYHDKGARERSLRTA